MSAFRWQYLVSYDKDVKKAFESLRKKIYQENKRELIGEIAEEKNEVFSNESLTLSAYMKARKEILGSNCSTHSILDITDFQNSTDPLQSGIISIADKLALFGTIYPVKSTLLDNDFLLKKVQSLRAVGQCTAVVLFENKKAKEILFCGMLYGN